MGWNYLCSFKSERLISGHLVKFLDRIHFFYITEKKQYNNVYYATLNMDEFDNNFKIHNVDKFNDNLLDGWISFKLQNIE